MELALFGFCWPQGGAPREIIGTRKIEFYLVISISYEGGDLLEAGDFDMLSMPADGTPASLPISRRPHDRTNT
jgi:hypothetical protein